jgi:hypothetical protein
MVEMEGMHMVEEQPSKQRSEVEGMDMVKKRLSKQQPEMKGMDMLEDTTTEVNVEVVKREHKSVMLVKHLTNDGAERHR